MVFDVVLKYAEKKLEAMSRADVPAATDDEDMAEGGREGEEEG